VELLATPRSPAGRPPTFSLSGKTAGDSRQLRENDDDVMLDPLARVNALWVLESLSALDDPLLLHAAT